VEQVAGRDVQGAEGKGLVEGEQGQLVFVAGGVQDHLQGVV
jgi:hypothetical protein